MTNMSCIVGDKNHFASLGEAFAFIDSSEFSQPSAGFGENPLLHNIPGGNISPTDVGMKKRKTTKGKKRKRNNLSSSTRLHQCKKAEILYLRKRVVEMEEELQQMQARCKRPFDLLQQHELNSGETTWEKLAEANRQARLESEATNRALKVRVANQVRMSGALGALFQQIATEGTNTAFSQTSSIGTDTAFGATGLSDAETLLLERDLAELDII